MRNRSQMSPRRGGPWGGRRGSWHGGRHGSSAAGIVLAGVASLGGVVGLSGCSFNSPVQTQAPYQPSDGAEVDMGSMIIRNLLVVATGPDAPGQVSGMILNKGTGPQVLTISAPNGSTSKTSIPPGTARELSAAPGSVVLAKAGGQPGGLVQLTLSTPTSGTSSVGVPVLLPQLYYSTLTPTAPPTSGTPSTPGPLPSTAETGGNVVPETNSPSDRP